MNIFGQISICVILGIFAVLREIPPNIGYFLNVNQFPNFNICY